MKIGSVYRYRGEHKWDSLWAIFDRAEDGVEYDEEESVSKEDGKIVAAESEHESDVVFLGNNLREEAEVIDLCSSEKGDDK
ncbi:UNVERIFIED_CONTAM: hypothetical protein Slati_3852800 [Sesamum latifolium]|uniref:Uncharacterized protein n=1 Tax=Sesamum latifolium TaxID=2727402 RepID=A0AAW2TLJ1_9LAMI